MNIQTNLYPSANGFVLIDNLMVPFEFLERLQEEALWLPFGPEDVLSLEDNCSDEFWASLSPNQKSVFGPCLLILMENGLLNNFFRHDR